MRILHNIKVRWMHPPKTGGTTIGRALSICDGTEDEWIRFSGKGQRSKWHDDCDLHSCSPHSEGYFTISMKREIGELVRSIWSYSRHLGRHNLPPCEWLNHMEAGEFGRCGHLLQYYSKANGLDGYIKPSDRVIDIEEIPLFLEELSVRFGHDLTKMHENRVKAVPFGTDLSWWYEFHSDRARNIWKDLFNETNQSIGELINAKGSSLNKWP